MNTVDNYPLQTGRLKEGAGWLLVQGHTECKSQLLNQVCVTSTPVFFKLNWLASKNRKGREG